jgi:peptidoglycan-associated lipoprotein
MKSLFFLCLLFGASVAVGDELTSVPDRPADNASCAQALPLNEPRPTWLPIIIYQPYDAFCTDYSPYQLQIQQLKDYLSTHPNATIVLAGHTDEQKDADYSLGLGQRYADGAQKHLVSQGFDPLKIRTISYGKFVPAVKGHNKKARAKNRRVEITLRDN